MAIYSDRVSVDYTHTGGYAPIPHPEFSSLLQLVEEVVEGGDALLQSLPLPRLHDDDTGFGIGLQRAAGENLPMVEHALWESLSRGGGSQFGGETEGLHDGEIGFDHVHGRSLDLLVLEHVTSLSVQDAVDATDGLLWALDFNQVDGL